MAIIAGIMAQIGFSMVKAIFTSQFDIEKIAAVLEDASVEGFTGFISNRIDDQTQREEVAFKIRKIYNQLNKEHKELLDSKIRIPENEKHATLLAVQASIEGTTSTSIIKSNFSPSALKKRFYNNAPNAKRDLSQDAQALYEELLGQTASIYLRMAREIPDFEFEAQKTLLLGQTDLQLTLNTILKEIKQLDKSTQQDQPQDQVFTRAYLNELIDKFNYMDHLGIANLSAPIKNSPLDIAYIQLNCIVQAPEKDPRNTQEGLENVRFPRHQTLSAEELIQTGNLILIRGEAGCGKTTVLRWLAVQIAKQQLHVVENPIMPLIPFYIRLREYSKKTFPTPEQFLSAEFAMIPETKPTGWEKRQLQKTDSSIIFIDGFDEVPKEQRTTASQWVNDLIRHYPHTRIVITSRPKAVSDLQINEDIFWQAEIQKLDEDNIPPFISAWHTALEKHITDPIQKEAMTGKRQRLEHSIVNDKTLLMLADSPLLLSAMCALNHETNETLPRTRIRLYGMGTLS